MTLDEGRLLTWPQWSRVDDKGLARFVTPQASRWLALPISRFDLASQPDQRRLVTEAIYDALKERTIRYAFEMYHPSQKLQTIRTPPEILIAPQEGTCLDLASLFCGLCLAYELLPILILIKGHALAAVSLTHGVRDWNRHRPGLDLFATGPLTDVQALRDLIDEESFLAVECTGFAHSDQLGRKTGDKLEAEHRTGRVLTFDQAVHIGRKQLDRTDRPFQFALDIAIAHYGWHIEPHPLEMLPGAWMTNIFRLFSGASALLSPHLKVLDFEGLVEERARNFVGRDFIFHTIDKLLKKSAFPSGYILIRGEPGIGKTALLSQLVKTRGYVHHFNIAQQNIRYTRTFLENVCAQLIIRYQLDHPILPPEATEDSAFLSQLLTEAAKKAGDQPVVVLVDALNEAEDIGLAANTNRLYLPAVLPKGVFFVLTSREQMDYQLDVDRREDLHLYNDDSQNLKDVRTYVRNFLRAHQADMAARIAAWNINADEFIEVIADKSQGNFMYLVHVLNDLSTGRIAPEMINNIQNLPRGLRAYYQRHWRTMKVQDQDRFERVYEPVLRLLAAVREPVSIPVIEEWTKVEPTRIREVIRNWRPFLNEGCAQSGEALFRIYHASFQDFLAEEDMGLRPLHDAIARNALSKIPGFLDNCRNGPGEGERMTHLLSSLTEYELQHLPEHLELAGRIRDIHHLLRLDSTPPADYLRSESRAAALLVAAAQQRTGEGHRSTNAWFLAKQEAGLDEQYHADILRAWRLATRAGQTTLESGGEGESIGLQCRYALLTSSIASLATTVDAETLSVLVKEGIRPASWALHQVSLLPTDQNRSDALVRLAPILTREQVEGTIALASNISDPYWRIKGTLELLPHVEDARRSALVKRCLNVITAVRDKASRAQLLILTARYLVGRERGNALRSALEAIEDVCPIAIKRKPDEERAALRRAACTRGMLLAQLVPELPPSLFDATEQLIEENIEENTRSAGGVTALGRLASRLPQQGHDRLMTRAFEAARKLESGRSEALAYLAALLPDDFENGRGKKILFTEALEAMHSLNSISALVELARGLGPHQRTELLGKVRSSFISFPEALVYLMRVLPPECRTNLLREAFAGIKSLNVRYISLNFWSELGSELAKYVSLDTVDDCARAAAEIRDINERKRFLLQVASALPNPHRKEALRALIQVAGVIGDAQQRANALLSLAPQLREPEFELTLSFIEAEGDYEAKQLASVLRCVRLPPAERQGGLDAALNVCFKLLESSKWLKSSFPYKDKGLTALGWLAPHLPDTLLEHTLRRASLDLSSPNQCVEVFSLLVPHLSNHSMATALELARTGTARGTSVWEQWQWDQARAEQLCELLPYLRPELRAEIAAEVLRTIAPSKAWLLKNTRYLKTIAPYLNLNSTQLSILVEDVKKIARSRSEDSYTALRNLLPYLPPNLVQNVAEWALDQDHSTTNLSPPPYLAVLDQVPARQRRRLIKSALKWARQEDRDYLWNRSGAELAAWKRARLIPLIPEQERLELIRETLTETVQRGHHPDVLEEIWSAMGDLDRATTFALWSDTLRSAAQRARPELADDLQRSSKLIARLGGLAAVRETAGALIEMGTWFP